MARKNILLQLVAFLSAGFAYSQVVGPYTGSTYLTNITGPCSATTLSVLGDSDFTTNGTYEIAYGTVFEGTWASGLGYSDGPGPDLLCVSLHTEESWNVALRLSDGSLTAPQLANMTAILDDCTWGMYDCSSGTLNPGWFYDRRTVELDFASFSIPAGLTVVGAQFTLMTDNAGYCDPVGILLLTTTTTTAPTATNNGPLCEGATLQLDLEDVTADMTYSWSGPNGFSSTLENPSITFTAAAAGTYDCVVTNTVTGDVYNISTTVAANPQPDGTINFTNVCAGQAVNFGFTPVAGQTISSYGWNFSSGTPATSTLSNPSSTFPAGGNYTVTLGLTNNFGCVALLDTVVPVASGPTPSFSAAITEKCAPAIFTMTNQTNPADVASYVWTFNNGGSSFSSTNLNSPQLPAGVYDVTLTVTSPAGCVGSTTVADYLTAVQQPIANFYWTPGQVIATNTDVTMVNTSIGADSYQWTFENGVPGSSSSEDPLVTLPNGVSGNYEVTLIATSSVGCADTITKVIEVSPFVSLYVPNTFTPDGDEFNQTWRIYIDGIDVTTLDLKVYNRWGETVWECHDPEGEWDGTYAGKIVPSGLYTWTIRVKDSVNDGKYEYEGHVLILK